MIVFLTTRQHSYTVASLCDRSFGTPTPVVASLPYEDALLAPELPEASFIFADVERLSPWERLLAGDLHRALRAAGCRCLNDPARLATRYPLLRRLHEAGRNPFRAWRLEEGTPRPAFPVFLRNEADHGRPLSALLHTPAELAAAVAGLAASGVSPAGVIAVEYCAEPIRPGVWRKFGSFRIGEAVSTDHAIVETDWFVKFGTMGLADDAMTEAEHAAVAGNLHAVAVGPAFELAGIEYGRADHAAVGGRTVVYEINTNPFIGPVLEQRMPLRNETLAISRGRFAAGLAAIDGGDGRPMPVPRDAAAEERRERCGALGLAYRP
ncbi:hypothetical protein [Roseomonas sp. BN140053]|uniref:hypothetical protein n=1 Tax=Roseomonas sp. BN140053 TaxID=3391898 RepID=UPI0039EAD316